MIRSKQPLNLHIIRHAEAYKNLEKKHGGGNQKLTQKGIQQCKYLGEYLLKILNSNTSQSCIVYQPEDRSKETAIEINKILSCNLRINNNFSGIGLGERAGLSEDELKCRFPEIAKAIDDWKKDKSNFNIPSAPGSESMDDFANRILKCIQNEIELCFDCSSILIICTTSTIVMINHLLSNDGYFNSEKYEFIDVPLSSISSWKISHIQPIHISNFRIY